MKILVVDDDPQSCRSIDNFISNYLGHEVTSCQESLKALEILKDENFPMIISDIRMPKMNGIKLLENIKKIQSESDVVMITGHAEIKTAIEALRAGAYDYLQKPLNVEELAEIIKRVAEHQTLLQENREFKNSFNEKVNSHKNEILTKMEFYQHKCSDFTQIENFGIFSEKMKNVMAVAAKFRSDRSVPVLIEGETGTGKEMIARFIHGEEDRYKPFISINCSAITPTLFESEFFGYASGAYTGAKTKGEIGKLEMAQGGTIFLDEIGDLPLEMQPKLLRVMQQKEFYRIGGTRKIDLDVRIICATNRNLKEMIERNLFRQDLYYRLNTGSISIQPLRERKEAIKPLTMMFLQKFSREKRKAFKLVQPEAMKILKEYSWPGNIRELQNAVERVVLLHNDLELRASYLDFIEHPLAREAANTSEIRIDLNDPQMDFAVIERKIINKALEVCGGNKTQAAKLLKISRNKLLRKL